MNSEITSAHVALVVYDYRLQAVLRSVIELWASALTDGESNRRVEALKNKRKVIQSFFD